MRRLNGTWETGDSDVNEEVTSGRTTRARVRMRSIRHGTARSSDEVLYKRREPRGGATEPNSTVNPKGEELMNEAKPFLISKREVWEAYQRVKANRGAAGIDEQSITEFEKDLKDNLYKLWNRMSSGSYFPPPVRRSRYQRPVEGKESWGF